MEKMAPEAFIIAKQQLELENYRMIMSDNLAIVNELALMFIAIGAPLNDNALQFNKEQLEWARKVYQRLGNIECELPEE